MANKRDSSKARRLDGTAARPVPPPRPPHRATPCPLTGTKSPDLAVTLVRQATSCMWWPSYDTPEIRAEKQTAALDALAEFKPADGVEGMMAAQAVALHSASMECLRRAMIAEQPAEMCDQLRRQAMGLSRTFLDVVAALDRKRGKGTQVVRWSG